MPESEEFLQARKKIFLLAGIFIIAIAVISILSLAGKKKPQPSVSVQPTAAPRDGNIAYSAYPTLVQQKQGKAPKFEGDGILATVGDEAVYVRNIEDHPTYDIKRPDMKRILANKYIEDSMIIQEGIKQGIISADPEFFGSENVSYEKRQQAVDTVKDSINSRAGKISCYVVAVWFNNGGLGEFGEASKQKAYEKITAVYNKVKSGQIPYTQAKDLLINDPEMPKLDESYIYNSFNQYERLKGEGITFDKGFNDMLWTKNPGEMTDVVLVSDKDYSGNMYEALYIFGGVISKADGGTGLDPWLEEISKKYEINYQ